PNRRAGGSPGGGVSHLRRVAGTPRSIAGYQGTCIPSWRTTVRPHRLRHQEDVGRAHPVIRTKPESMQRRDFLRKMSAAAAGMPLATMMDLRQAHAAFAATDRVNIAVVGVGGKGWQ